jgi:hypothetical protein
LPVIPAGSELGNALVRPPCHVDKPAVAFI